MNTFLELKNVSVFRRGEFVFRALNWKINTGESWVIVGEIGSGKTSLLQTLDGTLHIKSGETDYSFLQQKFDRWELKRFISCVSFAGSLVSGSTHYYQERYNPTGEASTTVRQYLHAETFSTQKIFSSAEELLDVELIKLSNGQMRKVQLLKVLTSQPKLLLLDNPFAGLDSTSRQELKELVAALLQQGNPIILTCNRIDEIPEGFTHALKLHDQKIVYRGELAHCPLDSKTSQTTISTSIFDSERNSEFKTAISFNQVTVRYGSQEILKNVSFEIRKNKKFVIRGANGSGKSTLLSLINADNPQAYANDIVLFDQKKESQSIWALKKRIGYFSPELQAHFHENLTVQEVLSTGLTGTYLPKKNLSEKESDKIAALLSFYGRLHLLNKSYVHLSSGEQQLALLLRAFMQEFDLLILDEPFQGLDEKTIDYSRALIDQLCKHKTLLFVSHYHSEIPSCITDFIELENGSIIRSGKLS